MTVTIGVTQRIRLEMDVEDVEPITALFAKLKKYKKPAGYTGHDNLDLTREEKDYIKQLHDNLIQISTTTITNEDDDE